MIFKEFLLNGWTDYKDIYKERQLCKAVDKND